MKTTAVVGGAVVAAGTNAETGAETGPESGAGTNERVVASGDRDAAERLDHGRRRVLGIAGAGLAAGLGGFAPLAATSRGVRAQEATEITFAFGPDDSGSLEALIEAFNAENEGRIRVKYREMARLSGDYHRQIRSDFEVGSTEIDVFGADIVWTAEFATRGWVQDLGGLVSDAYGRGAFLEQPLRTARYRGKTWGVPWYTDAGMLFYRRDLLEEGGFAAPPATWSELAEMDAAIRGEAGVEHGLVFQGADYEGGTANALEFIWGAGGRVLTGNVAVAGAFGVNVSDPNVVVVDSADSARGLDSAAQLLADGVAPEAVTGFRERQSSDAFLSGNALFMRNWPFVYGLFGTDGVSISPEQVGIASIPTTGEGRRSYSCLGGWNLMLASGSSKQEAAREFIRFASAPEQQRQRALDGGFLPTLAALYDDESLVQEAPILSLGREAIDNARSRPVSPFYDAVSPRLAGAFNRVLRGELDGSEAARRMKREMQSILRRRG